jgi:hypothetical protein
MLQKLKARFWEFARWFGVLFLVLLVSRMLYGYLEGERQYDSFNYDSDYFSSKNDIRRNYASEKVKLDRATYNAPPKEMPSMDATQKFEKTATMRTKTNDFENDEKTIRAKTKSFGGVIQFEQNNGLSGSRQLHLSIGVNPEKFDSFYVEMQKIGVVLGTEITKIDKTTEYRQLNAKKASIEKTLLSLNELKSKGGEITDFVNLNNKIQELEERLQALGVELGNFDEENEFCTVKISIYEGTLDQPITIIYRLKTAFEWAVEFFAIIVFSLLGMSLAILILLFIIEKLKKLTMHNNENSK